MTRPIKTLQQAEADPLLTCLIAITAHHDRAASADAIMAGLPLVDGRLTPQLLVRAAERAGYVAKIIKRPVRKLANINLPAVLLLNEQNACVLLKQSGKGKFQVFDPVINKEIDTTIENINSDYTGFAILLKPELQEIGD